MLDLERHLATVDASQAPAIAIGVYEDGEIRVACRGAPPDAQFRIASLTKPFVAQLVLTFVERGLLDLDGPPLPAAPTVRQLLAHGGGVQTDLSEMNRFGEGSDALGAAVREVLSRGRRFRAGRAWEYANSGYWILADAVARASGEEFERAFDQHLLRPLGLEDTGWLGDRLLTGHADRGRPVAPARYPRARRPSGGLISTIGDVVNFGVAALASRRLHRSDDPRRPTLFGARSAIGWQLDPAGQVAYHDGDYGGFCARLSVAPAHNAVVAVSANAGGARHTIRSLADTLLRDLSIPLASPTRRGAIMLSAYATLGLARTRERASRQGQRAMT